MDGFEWLAELHRAHYDQLLRLARNRLAAGAATMIDGDDIVQEAFLLAVEKNIRDHEAPLWWLMKTVNNLSMRSGIKAFRDYRKHQRVIQHIMDNAADRSIYAVERQEDGTGEREFYMMAMQVLTPDEWEFMQLYCLSGVSNEVLARHYNITVTALRVRIHRLRAKFRKAYYGG